MYSSSSALISPCRPCRASVSSHVTQPNRARPLQPPLGDNDKKFQSWWLSDAAWYCFTEDCINLALQIQRGANTNVVQWWSWECHVLTLCEKMHLHINRCHRRAAMYSGGVLFSCEAPAVSLLWSRTHAQIHARLHSLTLSHTQICLCFNCASNSVWQACSLVKKYYQMLVSIKSIALSQLCLVGHILLHWNSCWPLTACELGWKLCSCTIWMRYYITIHCTLDATVEKTLNGGNDFSWTMRVPSFIHRNIHG